MASTDAPRFVELTGVLPPEVLTNCAPSLGLYKRQFDVGGKPSYVKVDNPTKAMWRTTTAYQKHLWLVASKTNIGTSKGHLALRAGDLFVHYQWLANVGQHPDGHWLAAPNLRATALIAAADDEVTVVATSTPEARNTTGRKHALDLELFEPKRAKTPSLALETMVAKRRSVLTPAVDKKVVRLTLPAFELFVANKIDAAELEARKAAARKAAEAEDKRLRALDAAHEKYTAAVEARAAAEDAAETLRADEDAAEAELRKLLPAEAGPSGVVKGEA